MQLNKLLKKIVPIDFSLNITDIVCDSRKVRKGSLFLAYPGEVADGRKYIKQAAEQGATAILYEKKDSPE